MKKPHMRNKLRKPVIHIRSTEQIRLFRILIAEYHEERVEAARAAYVQSLEDQYNYLLAVQSAQ